MKLAPAVAFSLAIAPALAQPQPAPVFRVGVDLVQVDVVVTDGKGSVVPGLKAEDFEIRENGRVQTITHFEYVSTEAAPGRLEPPPGPAGAPPSVRSAQGIKKEEVRRVIVLVVDDFSLSFQGALRARKALLQFIDDELRPGDLAAVVRLGGGMGFLQQLTTDKTVLRMAAEQIGVRLDWAPLYSDVAEATPEVAARQPASDQLDRLGTQLRALAFVADALRTFPGRKSMIVVSERMSIRALIADQLGRDAEEHVRRLAEAANRASVAIYGIDTRNRETAFQGPIWDPVSLGVRRPPAAHRLRAVSPGLSQERMHLLLALADETGGRVFLNQSRAELALRDIEKELRGYYLIGYAPDESTFRRKPSDLHRIKVRVKRPGLAVRTRRGFLAVTDADRERERQASFAEPTLDALLSPFARSDLAVRLTSMFGHDPTQGSVLRSFVHVDVSDLPLTPDADGVVRLRPELSAIVFGDNGVVLGRKAVAAAVDVRPERLETFKRAGAVLDFTVPAAKPGSYQLRVAVREPASGRLGTAQQMVEVPPLRRDRLTLSGIVLAGRPEAAEDADGDSDATPAVRRFRPGADVDYALVAYGGDEDAGRRPRLSTELRLHRLGDDLGQARVIEATPMSIAVGSATKPPHSKPVHAAALAGHFRLPDDAVPGEYALEVVIGGQLASGKHASASQWVGLEVTAPAARAVPAQ